MLLISVSFLFQILVEIQIPYSLLSLSSNWTAGLFSGIWSRSVTVYAFFFPFFFSFLMPWSWKLVSVWCRLLFYFIVLFSFFCYWSLPLLMFWAVKGGKFIKRHLLKLTGYSFPFLSILSPVNNADAMNSFESQTSELLY